MWNETDDVVLGRVIGRYTCNTNEDAWTVTFPTLNFCTTDRHSRRNFQYIVTFCIPHIVQYFRTRRELVVTLINNSTAFVGHRLLFDYDCMEYNEELLGKGERGEVGGWGGEAFNAHIHSPSVRILKRYEAMKDDSNTNYVVVVCSYVSKCSHRTRIHRQERKQTNRKTRVTKGENSLRND